MKYFRLAVLIGTASCVAFPAAQDAPLGGAAPPGGTVEGSVVNSVTGAGIRGASVVLTGGGSRRYETASDGAGHFKITGMAPGSYFPRVEKDGFSPWTDLRYLFDSGLRVASAGDPLKLDLKLAPLDTILGRVLGPEGTPAAGVEVRLNPNITANQVVTDEEGRFALRDIRRGSYTLIAKPPEHVQPGESSDGTRTALVTTYYPSTADPSLAQQIVLPALGNSGDYEIRMQTATVHRVRGVVLDAAGKPAPGATLTLAAIPQGTPEPMGLSAPSGGLSVFALGMRRGPRGAPAATVLAGDNGQFEFPAVPSGDWRISAESDAGRDTQTGGAVSARGSAGAFVGRGDVDDLQIHIAAPFNLVGAIEWQGEDPGAQRASGSLSGAVTLIHPDSNEFVGVGIEDSGTLWFENILPGRYQFIVKPGLTAQIFLGANEVTGTVPLSAGGPRLRVVLKTWSGSVRGRVEKGGGATVVLVPQRVEGVTLGQTAVCAADGSFELSEVSPGDYFIAAFDQVDGLSPSAALLSLAPSRGTSIQVGERAAANIRLSVIAAPR